ncbi:hypothetical protein KPL50_25765 [Clostridium sp. CF012]|nr:hypothetical protein [Clostridium sp. CF012]
MANIYFSDSKRKIIIELPVLPEEMPELSRNAKNEEFETFNNGAFNLLGNVGLITFTLDSFLPAYANKYRWAKSQINPYSLINLWASNMANKTPLRVIMNRNLRKDLPAELLNLAVSVENMKWHEDRTGDIKYTIDFKEYREIK